MLRCLTSWDLQDQVKHMREACQLEGISNHRPIKTEFNITAYYCSDPGRTGQAPALAQDGTKPDCWIPPRPHYLAELPGRQQIVVLGRGL